MNIIIFFFYSHVLSSRDDHEFYLHMRCARIDRKLTYHMVVYSFLF